MPHDQSHPHTDLPSDPVLRVKALETLLVDKGLVDPAALDEIIETYAHKVGPQNGAKVVAKMWTDPAFRTAMLSDPMPVLREMDLYGRQGEHMVFVENTPEVHNVVVCTLCSCYPWPLLGIPPGWYKSDAYRARVVREPRAVLAEFGVTLPQDRVVRVWDSTAETRYLVVPERPLGSEAMSEEELAKVVTRDAMIGTGMAKEATL
jgi:nitrile hydratase